jgi:hypothetical protein
VRAAISCDLHKDGRKLGTTYVASLERPARQLRQGEACGQGVQRLP